MSTNIVYCVVMLQLIKERAFFINKAYSGKDIYQ